MYLEESSSEESILHKTSTLWLVLKNNTCFCLVVLSLGLLSVMNRFLLFLLFILK